MTKKSTSFLHYIGPGIAVAATGVGAGDMVAAAVGGAKYGTVLLWSVLLGSILKYVLNEGIARWQLATGKTLLEGWFDELSPWVGHVFLVYLCIWSFIVSGALISACGLAAHSIFPQYSIAFWGIIHSIVAGLLVWKGSYQIFESSMKIIILMMFLLILFCAVKLGFNPIDLTYLFIPSVPKGSVSFVMGVIGGVGGSVTLLNYAYWIQEKGWSGKNESKRVRWDLGTAYFLTGIFGVAIILISSRVNPEVMKGSQMLIGLADQIQTVIGPIGRWIFLVGFWGAVFSSMLGVWHGVPFIFQDYMRLRKSSPVKSRTHYLGFLAFLTVPPMLLLILKKPVWIIIVYAVSGSLFMPFLASTLLVLNNKKDRLGQLANSWKTNVWLMISIGVFGYLLINQIIQRFF